MNSKTDLADSVNTIVLEGIELHWLMLPMMDLSLEEIKNLYSSEKFPFLKTCVEKRQREFLSGRLILHTLLAPFNYQNFIIQRATNGEPTFPATIKGSLSHSPNYISAIVTNAPQVISIGHDIEEWIPLERAQKLSSSILNVNEKPNFTMPLENALTIIFSAKESLIKSFSVREGRIYHLGDFTCLGIMGEERGELRFQTSDGREAKVFFQTLRNHVCTFSILSKRYTGCN